MPTSGLAGCGVAFWKEAETEEAADELALDIDTAIFLDARHHIFLLAQTAHQYARAAIDKTLSEPFMQGIREAILDGAGPLLPMERIGKPVAIGNEGPGSDMGDAGGQRVDIAFGPIAVGELAGEPVFGVGLERGEKAKGPWPGVACSTPSVTVVGDLTHFHRSSCVRGVDASAAYSRRAPGVRAPRHQLACALVSPWLGGGAASDARSSGREAKDRSRLRHCRTRTGSKRWSSSWLISSAENGSASAVTPKFRHSCSDRRDRRSGQARPPSAGEGEAVEFPGRGEGDMVKIHVEAHADRVGRHHMIDVPD